MRFMRLFTTNEPFVTFDDREGGHAIPSSVLGKARNFRKEIEKNFSNGEVSNLCLHAGKWFARYSAPGYMDATEWVGPYDTEEQAQNAARELYGDDEEEGDEDHG